MRMVAAGILDEDDRLELIDGELLVMPPQDPPHASSVDRVDHRLKRAYGVGYRVRVQLPLALSTFQLPEPDVAVVRGDEGAFDRRHPGGGDTVLVVEVSDSSAARGVRKIGIYAAGGVACYWRLDVESRRLEVRTQPSPDGSYGAVRSLGEDDEVDVPETDLRWRVGDLLPAP